MTVSYIHPDCWKTGNKYCKLYWRILHIFLWNISPKIIRLLNNVSPYAYWTWSSLLPKNTFSAMYKFQISWIPKTSFLRTVSLLWVRFIGRGGTIVVSHWSLIQEIVFPYLFDAFKKIKCFVFRTLRKLSPQHAISALLIHDFPFDFVPFVWWLNIQVQTLS